jgi:hypothetical protein
MTKKEYVISLLTALTNSWSMAKWLLVLVENNVLDDATIDALTTIFKDAIATVKDEVQKQKLQKWLSYLEKIKEQEASEKVTDEKELQDIEKMLADLE